jgi:hypothetical protein
VSSSEADILIKDIDPDVRLSGLIGKLNLGEPVAEEVAQKILVKQRSGLGSLFLLGGNEGDAQFEKYKKIRLSYMSDNELIAAYNSMSAVDRILNQDPAIELAKRGVPEYEDMIRNQVGVNFSGWIDDAIGHVRSLGAPDLEQKIRTIGEGLRQQWMRSCVDAITHRMQPQDLRLVRETVASAIVSLGHNEIQYLAKYGKWKDVDLLLDRIQRFSVASTKFGADDEVIILNNTAADAVIQIAQNRISALLKKSMPDYLKLQIVKQLNIKKFASLSDLAIISLLSCPADSVRRAAALKAVLSLDKARLARILKRYIGRKDSYFYNSVLWLDLGLTLSSDAARRAAGRLLEAKM